MIFKALRHCASVYVCSLALAFVSLTSPGAGAPTSPERVTLRVFTEDLPKIPESQVLGRIDYDAFSIIEVSAATHEELKAAKVKVRKEKDAYKVGLQGREFDVRKGPPAFRKDLTAEASPGSPTLHIVHFAGPTKSAWLAEIESLDGKIVSYIPENSYLIWIDPAKLSALDRKHFVKWKGLYHPGQKIAESLERSRGLVDYVSVVIYGDRWAETIDRIRSLGAELERTLESPFDPNIPAVTALFSVDASLIPKIARLPDVVRLDRASATVGLDDEMADKIVIGSHLDTNARYSSWLQEINVTGAGSTVAVVDTGCDTNDNNTVHLDLRGRLSSVIRYDTAPTVDIFGHGTHVAGIAAGNGAVGTADDEGMLYGMGAAPGANLVIQSATSPGAPFPPGTGWSELTSDAVFAQPNPAFVSNNSWNSNSTPGVGYTSVCATFDSLVRDADLTMGTGIQPITLVFSAGNSGSDMFTLLEPKEAKNIITVGASENYRPGLSLGTGCSTSDNIDGIADFSSRGPCVDGRLAPTIVAPGTGIASAASSYATYGAGCSAIVDPITKKYAWMSGTSQAAPMVSGVIALIGEWWRSAHGGVNPSPAMSKAIIINGADDIAGGPDGRGGQLDHIPNGDQGWGRLNPAASIDPPNTHYEDQLHIFMETGQSRSYRIVAADPAKPLKITLVWSDAPGTPGAYAWANDLDLVVTGPSGTYLGNFFQSGWSAAGLDRDNKNNVECVYLDQPSGTYTVTVLAANIAANGVPGNANPLDQDFAIVIRNGNIDGTMLEAYSPVESPSPPQPDRYRAANPSGGWSAVGMQPAEGSDYDLSLASDPSWTTNLIASQVRGDGMDFIAINGNNALPPEVYPLATLFSGTDGYNIEWAPHTIDLVPGAAVGTFGEANLLRVWDIAVAGPSTCRLQVVPTLPSADSLDVGISVFEPTSGTPDSHLRTRQQSSIEYDSSGPGSPELVELVFPSAGRYGIVVWKKAGIGDYLLLLDFNPPTTPVVTRNYTYTTNPTELAASWSASDPETNIAKYEYKIGSSPGASDVVNWTDAGASTGITLSGLSLVQGNSYYFTVRATNGVGMTSEASSDGIFVAQAVSDIAAAKALPDGDGVSLEPKAVSAAFLDRFYIVEDDRYSGIGVNWTGNVTEGAQVTVIGTLSTANNERFIDAVEVIPE